MGNVSIIVGGQYGSEGKGKASGFWAQETDAFAVVRVGGPNSGHTGYRHDMALRMLPAGVLHDPQRVVAAMPAGSYIDVDVFLEEVKAVYGNISYANVMVDRNAMVIDSLHSRLEKGNRLFDRIGSTVTGTGGAVASRVLRDDTVRLAKDEPRLAPFLADTKSYLRGLLVKKHHIVIEGTQGYGLSNLHTPFYPFATARDTTAAGFLSETGLSPLDVAHVVMVIRAFPIRVGGNSGPLERETNWKAVSEVSGGEYFEEYTTVTKRLRRVAEFDPVIVREAIQANNPNVIMMNHVDYIDKTETGKMSGKQMNFVKRAESEICRNIDYVGLGPDSMVRR